MQTYRGICVNALSGLYLIVTRQNNCIRYTLRCRCQCPLGLIPHCYAKESFSKQLRTAKCQCPLGLIPHCYRVKENQAFMTEKCVNALSGLYLIVTEAESHFSSFQKFVSMPSRAYTSLLPEAFLDEGRGDAACQCPLGLIPHYYSMFCRGCIIYSCVSMPSRAYTSLLQYPFKNLGFMRFPEPIFAGICQNILIITHFHAC